MPWRKAVGAPVATFIAVGTGLLAGHFDYGVWAFFGAFTSMYVTGVPYRPRARILGAVGLGLIAALAVGSLTSGSPFALTLGLGLVAALATFVTVALDVPLPGSLMFILIAVLGAALPVDPALTPLRVLWAAMGAAIAWGVGMTGFLLHPSRPEQLELATLYRDLAVDAAARHNRQPHRQSRATLIAAVRMRSAGAYRSPALGRWLYRAARLERVVSRSRRPCPALARHLRLVAARLHAGGHGQHLPVARRERFKIARAGASLSGPERDPLAPFRRRRSPWPSALRPGSPARTAALRTGVTVTLATAFAFLLRESHPYWVPLTAGAVLQGPTPGVMLDRAVERVVGTALGLFLAGSLLALHPTLPLTLGLMLALQFLLLLLVVRNYALSVIFITALALVVIEGEVRVPLWPLMVARLENTLIGAALAAAALLLSGSAVRPTAPRPVPGSRLYRLRPSAGPARAGRNRVT